jgi:hypothetical protein
MATVNLGVIKPVFKGAYNNSTAYVLDNIVTSGGSSYICILASQGNAVSNSTYWTQMSAAGTDGTDIGTTITTQGDVLYRDGSGLARLPAGTSGQYLKTGGSGANPSWDTVSSDWVKILSSASGTGSTFVADNIFTTTYKTYKVFVTNLIPWDDNTVCYFQYIKTDGSAQTSGNYKGMVGHTETHASGYNNDQNRRNWGQGELQWTIAGGSYDNTVSTGGNSFDVTFWDPIRSDTYSMYVGNYVGFREDNSNFHQGHLAGAYQVAEAHRGFKLWFNSGSMRYGHITVYGLKH